MSCTETPTTTSRSARRGGMREVLGTFHPDFAYHEQPGAGHWWGSPCVDWPPLFAFVDEHLLPTAADVGRIDFITMSPGVSARADWATVEAQVQCLAPSAVRLTLERNQRRISGTTENVGPAGARPLAGSLPQGDGAVAVELDGQTLRGISAANDKGSIRIWLVRKGSTWSASGEPPSSALKGPAPVRPVQGGVSRSIRTGPWNQGDCRRERLGACPGALRCRALLVSRQWFG